MFQDYTAGIIETAKYVRGIAEGPNLSTREWEKNGFKQAPLDGCKNRVLYYYDVQTTDGWCYWTSLFTLNTLIGVARDTHSFLTHLSEWAGFEYDFTGPESDRLRCYWNGTYNGDSSWKRHEGL